jgi:hypothetical protein
MYLRGRSRHFHKGDPFYFRNHFFYRNIKRYRDVIQSVNYFTRHGKKKNDKDETGNIQNRRFLKSANQKQELPVAAMFVNGSGQNEQSL